LHPDESFEISEDCLYLNVFTPAESRDESLPVLFWIYGGGFSGGRTSDPEFYGEQLCEEGAVLVTISYRCGPLGFFNLPELEKKGFGGNLGLMDQVAALKWVQENIAQFGGDPTRVLVHGQSAGGMSTRMQLTDPMAQGLFSRAVIQSGGGFNEADLVRPYDEFTGICASSLEHIGCTLDDAMKMDAAEFTQTMLHAKYVVPARSATSSRSLTV
jgi:carboxylesterase type B